MMMMISNSFNYAHTYAARVYAYSSGKGTHNFLYMTHGKTENFKKSKKKASIDAMGGQDGEPRGRCSRIFRCGGAFVCGH